MSLRFEGEETFGAPPGALFPRLADAGFMMRCQADVESVAEETPDRAAWTARPAMAFLTGPVDVVLRVTGREPGSRVASRVDASGQGASAAVETAAELTPEGTGTRLRWSAEVVEVGGLLKLVPDFALRAAAGQVVADVWRRVRERVGG